MLTPAKSVMHITYQQVTGEVETFGTLGMRPNHFLTILVIFIALFGGIFLYLNGFERKAFLQTVFPNQTVIASTAPGSFEKYSQRVFYVVCTAQLYIPLNSMMGIGYTYVWKNKRMGKEGVPGCRPSVVAVAAAAIHCAARRLPAAGCAQPSIRATSYPGSLLQLFLPAAAALLPFHELFERQFQPSTRSVYSDNRLHNTTQLQLMYQLSSQPTTIIVHCRFCRTEIKQRQTTHTKKSRHLIGSEEITKKSDVLIIGTRQVTCDTLKKLNDIIR